MFGHQPLLHCCHAILRVCLPIILVAAGFDAKRGHVGKRFAVEMSRELTLASPRVADGVLVTHNQTIETPFFPQKAVHEIAVQTRRYPVDGIVCLERHTSYVDQTLEWFRWRLYRRR